MGLMPVDVPRLGHNKCCGFHRTLPGVTHYGGIHCHVMRGLCSKELRSPAKSCVRVPFGKWIDLGPNSLVLIQRKAGPSGGRRVDLGQSLQEWAGGQAEAGNPSISLSPSLCRSPPPLPTGTWSHAELHSGVPEKEGEKTGVFIL